MCEELPLCASAFIFEGKRQSPAMGVCSRRPQASQEQLLLPPFFQGEMFS